MPATPMTDTNKYFARGVTAIVYLATVANPASPTRSEINAGLDLSKQVQATEGWMIQSNQIETPNLGSAFTGKIPGATSCEDSSLTTYADIGGVDARVLFPRGESGTMLIMFGGDVSGRPMDSFPVRVASRAKSVTTEEEAASVLINFAITAEPTEDIAIPA